MAGVGVAMSALDAYIFSRIIVLIYLYIICLYYESLLGNGVM